MAWALYSPVEFGPTSPDGSFVGYKEKLTAMYEALPDDEQTKYSRPSTFIRKTTSKFIWDFGAVCAEEAPDMYRLAGPRKRLADLMLCENAFLVVSEPLKQTIEQLAPDIHQFLPIGFQTYRGDAIDGTFFVFVIRQFREAIDIGRSDWDPSHSDPPHRYANTADPSSKDFSLVVSCEARDRAHFWRERKWTKPELFISNELRHEIKGRDLTVFRHYQVEEI